MSVASNGCPSSGTSMMNNGRDHGTPAANATTTCAPFIVALDFGERRATNDDAACPYVDLTNENAN
jgi:hypothetical protein